MTAEEEMEAIADMLKRAGEYKLEVEVVLELWRTTKANPDQSLNEAIFIALGEWDV